MGRLADRMIQRRYEKPKKKYDKGREGRKQTGSPPREGATAENFPLTGKNINDLPLPAGRGERKARLRALVSLPSRK